MEEEKTLLYEDEFDIDVDPPPRKTIWTRLKSRSTLWLVLVAVLVAIVLVGTRFTSTSSAEEDPTPHKSPSSSHTPSPGGHWVATWTAAQQARDLQHGLPPAYFEDGVAFTNTTIRQTHLMSVGAEQIRLRFSNAFAPRGLKLDRVTIALPRLEHASDRFFSGSGVIRAGTVQTLTFNGSPSVTIPPHGLMVSDTLNFPIKTGEVITISMYFKEGQLTDDVTLHLVSRTQTWFTHGDYTKSLTMPATGSTTIPAWYLLTMVEAWRPSEDHALVVLGDSVAAGAHALINSDAKWPNFLFDRMQNSMNPDLRGISVLNQALGGNQIVWDGKGPNLISRLDRDVLAVSGVKYAMIAIGLNDVGHGGNSVDEQKIHGDEVIAGYQQVITRLHAANIPVFASTLSPFSCLYRRDPDPNGVLPIKEAERLVYNEWIRNSGVLDAVIDFDLILRDPNNHTETAPRFSSEDCVHPNEDGYREMAEKFPLELFEHFKTYNDS